MLKLNELIIEQMGNYYCFMSGLPDLSLDNTDDVVSVADVKEQIEEQDLSKGDAKLISMFFLETDCRNVMLLLKGRKDELSDGGNFSAEELEEMIADAQEDVFGDDPRFPAFMAQFIREYNERKDDTSYFPDDALMIRYWEYVKGASNKTISAWADLNINLSNILTALIARQQGWDVADFVVGESEVKDAVVSSKAKDFDLGKEYDYVAQLIQIADCGDPVEKERRIDALKWLWLDDETFFDGFSVEAIYAYLCKVQMLERWRKLDPVLGRERFETIIENLRGEARVPDEFKR